MLEAKNVTKKYYGHCMIVGRSPGIVHILILWIVKNGRLVAFIVN